MTRHIARAVIGAGYGDEGKGLMTDILAARHPDSIVVRSNGGAQAGHTVVSAAGERHVFHHVGSGTFAGCGTHLSAFFVAHPMMLLDELDQLAKLGFRPAISSDPRALITTPFDVAINQAVELARGTARHGSCGLGFGETIERNLRPQFALTTKDLFRPDLADRLRIIASQWLPERLATHGLAGLPPEVDGHFDLDEVIARFISDCAAYLDRVALWPDQRLTAKGDVLFEGAQGLLLDQDAGAFPHVTRSNTGLKNMLAIASEAGIAEIEPIYTTRCYVTRHGAGPLAHEVNQIDGVAIHDPTNAPNTWQGQIRVAPLDTEILRTAIHDDLRHAQSHIVTVKPAMAVTCLDQIQTALQLIKAGVLGPVTSERAAAQIAQAVDLPLRGQSWAADRLGFRD